MKLVVTRKDGQHLVVDSESIKIIEPVLDSNAQPTGESHLIFGADLGRTVNESPADIAAAMGVIAVKQVAQVSPMAVAMLAKKKR